MDYQRLITCGDFDRWASLQAKSWVPSEEYSRLAENFLARGDTRSLRDEAAAWQRQAVKAYNLGDYHGSWICIRYAAYFQRCVDDWLATSPDAPITDEDRYGVEGAALVQEAEDRACSANGGM